MSSYTLPLAEHVALVTGASTGIGAAIAIGLAQAGADVVCHGNSHAPDATCDEVRKSGRRALGVRGDLAKRATASALLKEALEHFGRVDVLINNAGLIRRSPATTYAEEDWDTVIEVNLSSVFRLAQVTGAHMVERGRGKIVNIASLLSFQGGVLVAAYAASKGGRRAAHEGARQRVGPEGGKRQCDCARVHSNGQHDGAAERHHA